MKAREIGKSLVLLSFVGYTWAYLSLPEARTLAEAVKIAATRLKIVAAAFCASIIELNLSLTRLY